MKSSEWKTYRTRFLVKAKQLSSSLSFTDHLGRQHCGRKGDYLVESFDGVLSIAPRQIFEDIYVTMLEDVVDQPSLPDQPCNEAHRTEALRTDRLSIESIKIEKVKDARFSSQLCASISANAQSDSPRPVNDGPPRVRRKSPQPVRATSTRMSLM
jgi:hypothetical protein